MSLSPALDLLRTHLRARVPLSDADFDIFRSYVRPLALAKRQHLLLAGEPCLSLAFVTQGCLRSYALDAQGHEATLQVAPDEWWVSDLGAADHLVSEAFYLTGPTALFLPPFTDHHYEGITGVFREESAIGQLLDIVDRINANAAA